ncbi:MAG: signal peptide peptidase SppA, partial [Actinomycetota bacterium]
ADARALVLRIDSPGGTVVGSEALYLALRRVAEEKPVVAVMGEVAASGGYVAAIAAEHIVARQNTLTGSIGVILEYPEISGLLDDLGVEVVTIRSSDVKGGASPLRELSPAERAAQERIVADANAWFRELVAERRGFRAAAIEVVADGSAFTGRMAVENGLIDAFGGVR